jgi:hypothetical protein
MGRGGRLRSIKIGHGYSNTILAIFLQYLLNCRASFPRTVRLPQFLQVLQPLGPPVFDFIGILLRWLPFGHFIHAAKLL